MSPLGVLFTQETGFKPLETAWLLLGLLWEDWPGLVGPWD